MDSWYGPTVKFWNSPPKRAFFIFPLIVLLWEWFIGDGKAVIEPYYLLLLVWGYAQFRYSHSYHRKVGGRGTDLKPAERLITSGIYRYIRNPMYMGQIIFLIGLTLTLRSILAALITLGTMIWFHFRVLREEGRMIELYGDSYTGYMRQTKRWIPGLF